jgi:hypothetical protein
MGSGASKLFFHFFECHRLAISSLQMISAGLVFISWLSGCSPVSPQRQRLVSKPNMTFSDSLVFNYQNKLLPQVEPGSTFSGGAQAAGCTSCK